jgi:hypothetical protein
LGNNHPLNVTVSYSGTTLTVSVTDTITTTNVIKTFTGINLATLVGANTAYVGFTGGSGGGGAVQQINSWTGF